MRVCAVSFVECWRDDSGRWRTSNGTFSRQMAAVGSLFDEMILLIVQGARQKGGTPLPSDARVVALRRPAGVDGYRKLSVLARLPYYLGTIGRCIRQSDVVHVPLPGDLPLLAMGLALTLRKPLVARYCGSWRPTSQTTLMNRVTRGLMRGFAGGRNVMLATGEDESAPAPRVHWIFATALSRAELDELAPALERGLSDPPRAVYAGRLSPEKGVVHLLEAVAILRKERFRPLPTLTLMGDGPQRPFLEQKVQEWGCEELVSFTGHLDRCELSRRLRQADVCVQPSLTEGFSNAWLDAMAHGVPVLASDVGAAKKVLGQEGQRGWLVPPGDSQALADALRRVLTQSSGWPGLRRSCREYVRGRTLEAWAARIGSFCAEQWNVAYSGGKLGR